MSARIVRDHPFLSRSELTGRWWLVTVWRDQGGGLRDAVTKFPFDAEVEEVQKVALKDAADDYKALPVTEAAGVPVRIVDVESWLRTRARKVDRWRRLEDYR